MRHTLIRIVSGIRFLFGAHGLVAVFFFSLFFETAFLQSKTKTASALLRGGFLCPEVRLAFRRLS